MTDEMHAYYASQLDRDDNLIGTYTDAAGRTVVLVLDDTPDALAPHALRAEGAVFQKMGRFSILPPDWPEQPAVAPPAADDDMPGVAEPYDYINPKKRHRPAPGGVSVGHVDISAGTLSCYVKDGVEGALYILSNNHVLANIDSEAIGSQIVQPGMADGATVPGDVIANLTRFAPIRTGSSVVVDCAIAKVKDLADVDENIISIGKPHGVAEAYVGQRLWKYGRTTERTRGGIAATDAVVKVNYGVATITFKDVLFTNLPSAPGDSGSLMLDFASNAAVGLLFAGGETPDGYTVTIACKMTNVIAALGIQVPMPDPLQRSPWVDVSKWQGAIDWQRMKSRGVRGVIMKICQGESHIDERFHEYYAAAKAAGLLVGGYIFVEPKYSALSHMANFMNAVGSREFDVPVTLDCEADAAQSNQTITTVIQQLAEYVSLWQDAQAMIYTSPGFWNQYVLPWSGWKDYPLWVAYWSERAYYPDVPAAWKNADGTIPAGVPVMWQYMVFKGAGPFFGVSSQDIDMDTTFPAFEALLEEPPPPPDTVTLMVVIEGQGNVIPAGGQYPLGMLLTMLATPAEGWVFDGWRIGAEEWVFDENPMLLEMDGDIALTAIFSAAEPGGGVAVYQHNKGVTQVSGQNVRNAPYVGATIVGTLSAGLTVEIMEARKDEFGNDWVRLGTIGAKEYWAAQLHNKTLYIRYVLQGE